ncbi:MAG TPA: DICT sensory domain-containing protein, partial [Phototrophicaceae bacterium]|nr:DICT sensory domain-containing protein [Phototrophicaceae bacterium]
TASISLFHLLREQAGDQIPLMHFTKTTLIHLSHALENIVLQHSLPAMIFTGFQASAYWDKELSHYQELAQFAQQICIFAGKPLTLPPLNGDDDYSPLLQIELRPDDLLCKEWFLVIISERFSVLLCALDSQVPVSDEAQRKFETLWSFDIEVIEQVMGLLEQVIDHYEPQILPRIHAIWEEQSPLTLDTRLITRLTMDTLLFEEQLNQQLRQSMHQIAQSEARFRVLSENSPDSIYIINVIENRVVYNNRPGLNNHTDVDRQPRNLVEWVHPDEMEMMQIFRDGLDDPTRTGVHTIDCRIRLLSGKWEWVELRLTVLSRTPEQKALEVLMNLSIITGRKQLEAGLRATQEQLREVIISIPHQVYMLELDEENSEKVVSIFLSPGFSNLTGYPMDWLETPENLWANQLVHPDDQELSKIQFQRLAQGKSSTLEYRIIDADGRIIWVEDSARAQLNTRRIYGIISDITERRSLEDLLLNQEKLRLDLDKERELNVLKSTLMTMISHEFRTPLAAILSSSEFIERYGKRLSEEDYSTRVTTIRQQIQHLGSMLDDISRIIHSDQMHFSFNPIKADLEQLYRETVENVRLVYALEPDRFTVVISGEPFKIMIDHKLMVQVLTNLLDNAIKYSPPEGIIRGDIMYIGDQVQLRITDQGIGIPSGDLPYIFDTFHRASNVGT